MDEAMCPNNPTIGLVQGVCQQKKKAFTFSPFTFSSISVKAARRHGRAPSRFMAGLLNTR